MAKKQRRFVPRALFTAACAVSVVPVCALDACGGKSSGGVAPEAGAGGKAGTGGNVAMGVAQRGFGGSFSVLAGGFGGNSGVAAGGFLGVAQRGFGGSVAAGGFRGTGGVGAGGIFGVADVGFGGTIRDSGSDARSKATGGHASLDPESDRAFGELGASPAGEKVRATPRRRRT